MSEEKKEYLENIFMQLDKDCEYCEICFSTWSESRMNEDDVEYVPKAFYKELEESFEQLAEKHDKLHTEYVELKFENKEMKKVLKYLKDCEHMDEVNYYIDEVLKNE